MIYNGSDKHKQALFENKQDKLVAGSNISLTPQSDGTVEISAEGGSGTVTDVEVNGTSVVDEHGVAEITIPVDDVNVNGVSVVDVNKVAQITSYKELTQSEYDALPSSKLTDGILYCIKDTGIVEGDKYAPIIYSSEEREVGVWTDGKPLYQKTVTASITNSGETYVNCNIPNAEFAKLYDLALAAPQSRYFYNGYCLSDIYIGGFLQVTSSSVLASIYIGSSNLIRPATAYVTVIYTKTTDVPGSGTWGTDGVPMVHYDGTERIIGTWFGETLYEKVFISNSVMQATTQIDISNLDVAFGYVEKCYMKSSVGSTPMPDNNASTIYIVFDSYIRLTTTQEYATNRGANGYVCVFRYTKTT